MADGPSSAEDNAEHCPYPQTKAKGFDSIVFLIFALVALLPVRLFAGKFEPPKPIVTPAELAAAAAEVPVMRLDFTLPEEKDALESSEALSKRFFNTPDEMRYGGVTSTDWRTKWDLFSKALTDKAATAKLNADSLKRCLAALNYGRTKENSNGPILDNRYEFLPRSTPAKEVEAQRKRAEEEYAARLKDKEDHPESCYNESIAIIPVGAYLAKYAKGDCWIIVCHWEDIIDEKQLAKLPPEKAQAVLSMAHIMIWAMDTKTCAVIAYVTCD
jgi:hypothetical protein